MASGQIDVEHEFLGAFEERPELESLAREVGILQEGGIPSMRKNAMNADAAGSLLDLTAQTHADQFLGLSFPVSSGSGKRPIASLRADNDSESAPKKRKSNAKTSISVGGASGAKEEGKAHKGLRHFSMKVCEKVREKTTTNYNEVADELVREFKGSVDVDEGGKASSFDEKNIRRRVYDALNVLMAMDIITKQKKNIVWKGFPSGAGREVSVLKEERDAKLASLNKKKEMLQELLVQQIAFKNLVKRNETAGTSLNEHKIPLPFIIVNTKHDTVVNCEMGSDRTDIFINFSQAFEINDDNEILKRMGMQKTTREEAPKLIPPPLLKYLPDNYFDRKA